MIPEYKIVLYVNDFRENVGIDNGIIYDIDESTLKRLA